MILALVLVLSGGWAAVGDVDFGLQPNFSYSHLGLVEPIWRQNVPLVVGSAKDVIPSDPAVNIYPRTFMDLIKFTGWELSVRNDYKGFGISALINDARHAIEAECRKVRRLKIEQAGLVVHPYCTYYVDLASFGSAAVPQIEHELQEIFVNNARNGLDVHIGADLGARYFGLLPTLVKCGIVCRKRLAHQEDGPESKDSNRNASESGKPLGRSVIPDGAIIGFLFVWIAAGVIWATRWAIPKDKNDKD